MLVLIFLGLIIVWIVGYLKTREDDKRFKFGVELAQHLELETISKESYLGTFAFDAPMPNETLYSHVAHRIDQGAERRLGLQLARRIPKWALELAVKDIRSVGFRDEASYGKYINGEVAQFLKQRNAEITNAIEAQRNPAPQVNRRRRRRR